MTTGSAPPAPPGGTALAVEPAGALDPQGPVASEIAELWWLMLGLGVLAFVIFAVALVVALLRRPAGAAADTSEPVPGSARNWIVMGGVALPVVLVIVVLGYTVNTMRILPNSGGEDALVVEVTGYQYWWSFEYPELGVVTANELHIPVDRPIELRIRSADVIHSFWVPTLAGKLDALPEDVNTLVLEADEPGDYLGACAEFCGLQHAKMYLIAVAQTPDEFDEWVAGQQEPAPEPETQEAQLGRDLFTEAGCAGCHTIQGTSATGVSGPDLTHIASRSTIASGWIPLTHENLVSWITNPHDEKKGVLMPAAELDAEQIEAVAAYLETLE